MRAVPVSRLLRLRYSKRVDVVVGAENVAEERPELAGFLGEIDEEVVLQAAVDERAFHHLGVAEEIVIAAGDDTNHNVIGAEFQLGQGGDGEGTGGLGDDALVLV